MPVRSLILLVILAIWLTATCMSAVYLGLAWLPAARGLDADMRSILFQHWLMYVASSAIFWGIPAGFSAVLALVIAPKPPKKPTRNRCAGYRGNY